MPEYKFKGTADFSQHDSTLKNSASQVYAYTKKVEDAKKGIGNFAKKFGPLAGQIGLAVGALDSMKKAIKATEAGTDAFDSTLRTLKTSMSQFYSSLTNGTGIDSFLRDLGDIKKAAQEAYQAVDDLGTASMWKKNKQARLQADIAEDMAIVNNKSVSEKERKAAQERIKLNQEKIKNLSKDIAELMDEAYYALIAEVAGSTTLDKHTMDWLMKSRSEDGGSAIKKQIKYLEDLYKTEKTWVQDGYSPTTGQTFGHYDTTWKQGAEWASKLVDSYKRFLKATDEQIAEILEVDNSKQEMRQNVAQMENKSNKYAQKDVSTKPTKETDTTPKYDKGSLADIKAQIDDINKQLENRVLTEEEINDLLSARANLQGDYDFIKEQIDGVEQEEKTIEDFYASVKQAYKNVGLDYDELLQEQQMYVDFLENEAIERVREFQDQLDELKDKAGELGDAFGSFGDIFESLNDIFYEGDSVVLGYFSKISSGIGKLIPQLVEMYTASQATALAQGISSASGLVFPYNLAAIATVVATILSTFASLPKFAEGGIVGGGSFFGDRNIARVNSGEMILNGRQQKNLFAMINNGVSVGGYQNVTFTLRGEELIGLINNTTSKKNRVL